MLKKMLFTLIILVYIPCLVSAQKGPTLELEGRYWVPDLKGKIKVTEAHLGTDIDFKSDLGIKDENFPEGRLQNI